MIRRFVIPVVVVLAVIMVSVAIWRDDHRVPEPASPARAAMIPLTSRAELARTIAAAEGRLQSTPSDGHTVVRLADALVRLQRVNTDAGAAITAERHLREFLARTPSHYEAQQMLGVVLLSQHRFADAIREAERARAIDPIDATNYGIIGDGYLELGEYDKAFAAFDRMGQLRPGPPAYARVAYALELKGDLDGALQSMRMAADGTSAHDAEGQAWYYSQLGNLLLALGRLGDAKQQFERAAVTFPDHPYAMAGLCRVKIGEGDYAGALAGFERLMAKSPSPELAAIIGDLHLRLGRPEKAEGYYVQAEQLERDGWKSEEPQPQALARFLAERNRNIPEAVRLAEEAATRRRDLHTMDALAWAYFKANRLDDAVRASEVATRTGTRDVRIVAHAAAIRAARGDASGARELMARIPATAVEVDPIPWLESRRLLSTLTVVSDVRRTGAGT